jgi:hypothetical protein
VQQTLAGVQLDRPFVACLGPDVIALCTPGIIFTAFQIFIISSRTLNSLPGNHGPLSFGEFHRERGHDFLIDFVLETKNIAHAAVIAFGPQVPSGGGIDELTIDPHLVSRPADASLQHIAHAQFFGHLPDHDLLSLVKEGRVSGDDTKPGNLGEVCNQVFHQPVAKVFLMRIGTHVHERQHGDGRLVG